MNVAGWDADPIDVVNKNVAAAVKLGEGVGIPKTRKGLAEEGLDQVADAAAADHETIKAPFRKVMA